MKRVACVYHFYAHYRAAVMGGLLRSRRFDLTLLGAADSSGYDATIKPWVPGDRRRFRATPLRRLRGELLWQGGVIGRALSPRYDAIVFLASMNFASTWIAAPLARLSGKRVLFWAHGWTRPERGLKRLIRRCYFRLAGIQMLYGRRARRIAIGEGFDPRSLWVIYNSLDYPEQRRQREAVDPAELPALRAELFGDPDLAVVVCTTRLVALRRLDQLLRAVAAMPRKVGVLLVGDGPERARLEALASELGVAARFVGACYDEAQIARYVMCAAVAVAPGKVGLTAMHCLAYGVPVVTHDDPGDQMPEWEAIVPGRTGDLFRRDDEADLARVVARWIDGVRDRDAVARDCIAAVERFYNPSFQVAVIEAAICGLPAPATAGDRIAAGELEGGARWR